MPVIRRDQRGQALVGVMVVMLVLFAMAGVVAIGASTLLVGQSGNGSVISADFRVRSAVNDSVAQVAGQTRRCGAPPPLPSPSPTPAPTPTPPPLQLNLPGANPKTTAYCAREDAVVPGSLQRHVVAGGLPGCTTVNLGRPGADRLAVFFNARSSVGGWAYLDDKSAGPSGPPGLGCKAKLPAGTPQAPCSMQFDGVATGVVQVPLTCDVNPNNTLYLHVSNQSDGWPKLVFTARQDPRADPRTVGSIYLLASGTGLSRPDFEELVFYAGGDGTTNLLLYEGVLP